MDGTTISGRESRIRETGKQLCHVNSQLRGRQPPGRLGAIGGTAIKLRLKELSRWSEQFVSPKATVVIRSEMP